MFKLLAGPLRNVKVTVPDVVGIQVNVEELPAVTVSPTGVVGGFDVAPDCAATAVNRHAMTESGKMCILSVATERLMYSRRATDSKRDGEEYTRMKRKMAKAPMCERYMMRTKTRK